MKTAVIAVPGDLSTRTGGYGYDRRVIAGLRDLEWQVEVRGLDATFPWPTRAARADAAAFFAHLPPGTLVIVDGLAFGALADEAAAERDRLRIVALVHHPLAFETGLDADRAATLLASERRALASTRLVIVTSRRTRDALQPFNVPPDRIVVAEPGTDPAPLAEGSNELPLQLLCVASLTPRKGHDILIEALSALTDRHWSLKCAGAIDRDLGAVARLRALIEARGLAGRIHLIGDLDERGLAIEYSRSDLFVLPTYYEGYGMAVAEALARGIPVISTPTGAIPDLVGQDAGILVPPGDSPALETALRRFLDDPIERGRLKNGARSVRATLPTWSTTSARIAGALEQVLARD